MSEGQSHVHRIKFTPNKVLNREVELLSNGNIRGLTLYQMVIVHGTPSDPSSNAVTLCPGKIDYVSKRQYSYKWSQDISVNYYGNNLLPTTTGQHTMDIGAGADRSCCVDIIDNSDGVVALSGSDNSRQQLEAVTIRSSNFPPLKNTNKRDAGCSL